MPIERAELRLIAQTTFAPYLIEQRDELKLVEEVRRAAEDELPNERIFERYPKLAAAAYYLLNKSRLARTEEGQRTLDALRATLHQAMSPDVNAAPSLERAFSLDFRFRGIIHENPAAFYGLVHYLKESNSFASASVDFIDHGFHSDLLGNYRFGTNTILGIFGLVNGNGYVFPSVPPHVLDSVNLDRFDRLVREETSGPGVREGISLRQGIQTLFATNLSEPRSEIVTAIRYRKKEEHSAWVPRSPGSGIGHVMLLNASLDRVTTDLVKAYTKFRDTASEAMELQLSLYNYLSVAIGRRLSPEEVWDHLQEGRAGFPVREAIIEAVGGSEEEFDRVMDRAATKEGIFGEALRSEDSRGRRRESQRPKVEK